MLYSFDSDSIVSNIPYKDEFNYWVGQLSSKEYQDIQDELNSRISSNEIHTSSWIPGTDWTGTVFMPIYEKSCHYDEEKSGMCFGLILWKVLMDRDDYWGFGRYKMSDGREIKGMTYFKIEDTSKLNIR